MTNEHGKSAAAILPGDPFTAAYAAFENARTAFVEAAPGATQFELPDGAYDLLCKGSEAMDAMMNIPAPSPSELFLKLRALATCPWPWNLDFSEYQDRLTADAGTVSLQFPKAWLERWTGHGASVIADSKRGAQLALFKPEFFLSTDAAALEARQKKAGYELSADQQGWHHAYYDGQMNELSDVVDAVPGARQAIYAIVAENPAAGLAATDVGEAR